MSTICFLRNVLLLYSSHLFCTVCLSLSCLPLRLCLVRFLLLRSPWVHPCTRWTPTTLWLSRPLPPLTRRTPPQRRPLPQPLPARPPLRWKQLSSAQLTSSHLISPHLEERHQRPRSAFCLYNVLLVITYSVSHHSLRLLLLIHSWFIHSFTHPPDLSHTYPSTSQQSGKRVPLIKFLGKRSLLKATSHTSNTSTQSSVGTVAGYDLTPVTSLYDEYDQATLGRPGLSEAEMEAVETGGASLFA